MSRSNPSKLSGRAAAKAVSRLADEQIIQSGRAFPREFNRANSFFSSLNASNFQIVGIGGKRLTSVD